MTEHRRISETSLEMLKKTGRTSKKIRELVKTYTKFRKARKSSEKLENVPGSWKNLWNNFVLDISWRNFRFIPENMEEVPRS